MVNQMVNKINQMNVMLTRYSYFKLNKTPSILTLYAKIPHLFPWHL